MRGLLIVLWLACVSCAVAEAEQRLHVCGRELAETLRLICRDRGGFNDLPTVPLRAAGGVSRGVADDCCRLGCSFSTLLRYCKFDDVVQQPRAHDADCDGDEDEDDLFSLQMLRGQDGWCEAWGPATPVPAAGDVECTCYRSAAGADGGADQLENVVRKASGRAAARQPQRQPRPRGPPQQEAATRRPIVRGTVTPYFGNGPVAVVFSPPRTQ